MSWLNSAIDYQINLRGLTCREPRNAFEAIDEVKEPVPLPSPLVYLTEQLEKLQHLGVTLLHVMPPFEMGVASRKGIGSPYAVKNYHSIDPEYGTMDEFKAFVRRAHDLGFHVILGMVPNHTSRDNVWIDTHPEFYVLDEEGAPGYDLDWSDTAKLDYTNPGLRKAMAEVYDFWLNLLGKGDGVDGFRIDMAHFINDTSFWNETLPPLKEAYAPREILFMAECYGIDNNLDLFKRGMNAAYDDDLYKVCQFFYGRDAGGNSVVIPPSEQDRNWFKEHCDAFAKGGIRLASQRIIQRYMDEKASVPHPFFLARYTDNHDEGRGFYRFGPQATLVFNALIFMVPGTIPFLLTGQEFGAENRPPIHERIGLCDKGFKRLSHDETVDVPGIEFEGNLFARSASQREAYFHHFQSLCEMRHKHVAMREGQLTFIPTVEEGPEEEQGVVVFELDHPEESLLCMVNLFHKNKRVQLSEGKLKDKVYTIPSFSFQFHSL